MAVDDVQWLDPPSADALAFALRRVDCPLSLLLARRVGTDAQLSELERALAPDAVEHLRVGPLSMGAIQAVLRETLDRTFPRPTLVRIHEASGGNPFYALELARALRPDIDPTQPLAVPETLEGLVAARLAGLPVRTGTSSHSRPRKGSRRSRFSGRRVSATTCSSRGSARR